MKFIGPNGTYNHWKEAQDAWAVVLKEYSTGEFLRSLEDIEIGWSLREAGDELLLGSLIAHRREIRRRLEKLDTILAILDEK